MLNASHRIGSNPAPIEEAPDGQPVPQSLVDSVCDDLWPDGRRGPNQCLYFWRVFKADYRRSRAEPRSVFCGLDVSRGDRRHRPSHHRLAGRPLGRPTDYAPGPLPLCASHRVLRADPGLAAPLDLSDLRVHRSSRRGAVADPLAAVIAQRFDRRRGLAHGIGTAGVGLGVALMPQLAALLIDTFGWRLAYVGLAVAVLVVAFPPVALFLRDPPGFARVQRLREPADTGAVVPGVAAGAALRSWLFWGLAIAFFLDVIAINGTLTHIVPLLTDRGVPRQIATAALSGTGFALIFGRVLSGWCLDRPSYRTLNQHHLKRNRKFVDSPLEEAVRSELVSEGYFPASWENTGKFVDSGLSHPNFQSKALVDQRLTVRIPCEMEQGNNCALAGN